MHKNLVKNSKCMLTPTKFKITVASHVYMLGMHANPAIDEVGHSTYISRGSGGMLQIFCHERASGAI